MNFHFLIFSSISCRRFKDYFYTVEKAQTTHKMASTSTYTQTDAKPTRIAYDKKLLHDLVTRDEATLLEQEFGKWTKLMLVKFTCKCGKQDEKQLRLFVHHGGVFCRDCSRKTAQEKQQASIQAKYGAKTPFQSKEFRENVLRASKKGEKYTKKLLDEALKKDNAVLISTHDTYTGNTVISYTCKCGENGEKVFRSIIRDGGAKCKKCTTKAMLEKYKASILKKYGVEYAFQKEGVKEKARQNNKGVKYTEDLLESVIAKDEATLKGEYSNLSRDVMISYTCKCGKDHVKMFRYLVENGGATCEQCAKQNKKDKYEQTCLQKYGASNVMKNKHIASKVSLSTNTFTFDRLQDSLGENLVGEYDCNNIGRDTVITFKCFCCGSHDNKPFILLEESIGPFCKECTWVAKEHMIKKALKENYNVEHSLQYTKFFDKATATGCTHKPYKTPSGKILMYQGYEHLALDLLFMQEYDENDIVNSKKDVPEIWWIDADGKEHRYYVDIYIRSENRMIEIKSDYRYEQDKEKIEYLWRTCVAHGFNYEVWIFNKHKELITIKDYNQSSLSSSTSTSTS